MRIPHYVRHWTILTATVCSAPAMFCISAAHIFTHACLLNGEEDKKKLQLIELTINWVRFTHAHIVARRHSGTWAHSFYSVLVSCLSTNAKRRKKALRFKLLS